MKAGDLVVFNEGGRRIHCRILRVYDDNNPPAARIDRCEGGMVVRQDELESAVAYADRLHKVRMEMARENCAEIIAAFEGGARTIKAIAEKLGVKPSNVTSKFLQAKHHGLISVAADGLENMEPEPQEAA